MPLTGVDLGPSAAYTVGMTRPLGPSPAAWSTARGQPESDVGVHAQASTPSADPGAVQHDHRGARGPAELDPADRGQPRCEVSDGLMGATGRGGDPEAAGQRPPS